MNVDVLCLLQKLEHRCRNTFVRGVLCLLGLMVGLLSVSHAQEVSQTSQSSPAATQPGPPKSEFPVPYRYPGQRYLEYPALSGATQPFHLRQWPRV
jgi:hypothetical protein